MIRFGIRIDVRVMLRIMHIHGDIRPLWCGPSLERIHDAGRMQDFLLHVPAHEVADS